MVHFWDGAVSLKPTDDPRLLILIAQISKLQPADTMVGHSTFANQTNHIPPTFISPKHVSPFGSCNVRQRQKPSPNVFFSKGGNAEKKNRRISLRSQLTPGFQRLDDKEKVCSRRSLGGGFRRPI